MVRSILKKFEGLGQNVSFKLVHSVYELTDLAGQFQQMGSAPLQAIPAYGWFVASAYLSSRNRCRGRGRCRFLRPVKRRDE